MGNDDDDFFTPASENAVGKIFVADFNESDEEELLDNEKVLSKLDEANMKIIDQEIIELKEKVNYVKVFAGINNPQKDVLNIKKLN